MDPSAALNDLREQATDLTRDSDYADATDVAQFVEQFEALDEWLSKGGFLPEAWQPKAEEPTSPPAKPGDWCRIVGSTVEHVAPCRDHHPTGTVTDVRTGEILKKGRA